MFIERGREKKEKHRLMAVYMPPTGDLAGNPGRCLDRESKSSLSVCGMTSNPVSHAHQYSMSSFCIRKQKSSSVAKVMTFKHQKNDFGGDLKSMKIHETSPLFKM